MSRRILAALMVGLGWAGVAVAGDALFADDFEFGHPCVWSTRYPAVDCTGSKMFITLPGGAVTMTMVFIPAGVFQMGSPLDERGRFSYEDLHEVTLTRGYWMGETEVTQGQWAAVMGGWENTCGSWGVGADFPVYCVSWNEIAGFNATLNAYLASMGQVTGFRLPTDAEWERAARAGNQYRFSHGDVLECGDWDTACPAHDGYMWWAGSQPYTGEAHPVGSRMANGFGLYDMHGSEWEWVQDLWTMYLGTLPVVDPTGPAFGGERVIRGGHWSWWAVDCRSANRLEGTQMYRYGDVGFRLARTAG